MPRAIIFDCFGVVRTDSFYAVYRQMGGDPEEDSEFIRETLDASNSGRIPSSRPAVAARLNVTEAEWSDAIERNGGINYELLEYVRKLRGQYKTGMLSNIGRGGLLRFFERGFLEQYFDDIVASGDIGFAKPEARAYEIAAERLGARLDECVFTDDREECVEGARAVGMEAMLYRDFHSFRNNLEAMLSGEGERAAGGR